MAYLENLKVGVKVRYIKQFEFGKEGVEETKVVMLHSHNILLENGDMIPKWESNRLEIIN